MREPFDDETRAAVAVIAQLLTAHFQRVVEPAWLLRALEDGETLDVIIQRLERGDDKPVRRAGRSRSPTGRRVPLTEGADV